jgi:hypothetical protein
MRREVGVGGRKGRKDEGEGGRMKEEEERGRMKEGGGEKKEEG